MKPLSMHAVHVPKCDNPSPDSHRPIVMCLVSPSVYMYSVASPYQHQTYTLFARPPIRTMGGARSERPPFSIIVVPDKHDQPRPQKRRFKCEKGKKTRK